MNIFVYEAEGSSTLLGHVEVSQPEPAWNSQTICPPRSVRPNDRFLSVVGKSGLSFAVDLSQNPSEIMLDIPQTVDVKSTKAIVFPFNPPKDIDISDRQLDITVTSPSNIPAYLKVSQIRREVDESIDDVDYKKKSLRLSFAKKGRITLSKVSVPPLTDSTSSWFIGIALKNLTGSLKHSESKNVTLKLSQSFNYSYAGPICALFFLSLIVGLIVSIIALRLFKESLVVVNIPGIPPSNGQDNSNNSRSNKWIRAITKSWRFIVAMFKVVKRYWFSGGPKTYSYATGLAGFILMIGACQFVIANWYVMIQEGDRDGCYYNDLCYRVSDYHDIPLNLMISNLTYIVHAMILTVCVLYMETKLYLSCKKLKISQPNPSGKKGKQCDKDVLPDHVFLCPNVTPHLSEGAVPKHTLGNEEKKKLMARALKRKYSYSIGYSFAWALLFEGLFSLLYHLCPSRYTFQFDSAFMFVIAGLTVLLAYNGMELSKCPVYEAEQHPAEAHSVEQHPTETHSIQLHAGEAHPRQQQPGEQHPIEAHSIQHAVEAHSGQQQPGEQHPTEAHSIQLHAVEAHPRQQQPGEQHPIEAHSVQHAVEAHSGQQQPGEQHPTEAHSIQHAVEAHSGQQQPGEQHPVEDLPVGALNFFLYFIVPLFIFNYLGTLYHSESGLAKALQGVFFFFLFIWWVAMGWWAFHKLKRRKGVLSLGKSKGDTGEIHCNVCCYIIGCVIFPPALFAVFFILKDLSQAFLFTCIVESVWAVGAKAKLRQKLRALKRTGCTWLEFFQGCYIFATAGVFAGAFGVFSALATTNKTALPEDSRDRNEECAILGFFDWHDLWHFLSSFALLMGAFVVMFISGEPTNSSRAFEYTEMTKDGNENVQGNGMEAST